MSNTSLWYIAESIFSLLRQPDERAKRASLGRRSFVRILVEKKLILDAIYQCYAFAHPSSPEGTVYATLLTQGHSRGQWGLSMRTWLVS